MNVKIQKSDICGSVQIPPSKSVAHRMMIAAALARSHIDVLNGGRDVEATAHCLKSLADNLDDCPVLNAGESGSTLRFLLPVACALGRKLVFTGEGRLKDRPLDGLINCLRAHGAEIEKTSDSGLPLKVSGRLSAGDYRIDGGVSSQYITGLLFALPLLEGDSNIVVGGSLVSANYVDITIDVLKKFGIAVRRTDSGFFVKGNQRYAMPDDVFVEGDWSSAGFMLALGVLAGEVSIGGLNEGSPQGDRVVVELLKRAGADIVFSDGRYIAKKSRLSAIDFDAADCPDAVPIMATVLSFAEGVSHISSVDRLRDKESDRLFAVRKMLEGFGVKTEYKDDRLSVFGGIHKPCIAQSFNDHRMAMSAIVCALCAEGESAVTGVECIAKSYPDFLKDVANLGANIKTE